MPYPVIPQFHAHADNLERYAQLRHEYGSKGVGKILDRADRACREAVAALKRLPPSAKTRRNRPNALAVIRRLRPAGPRRMWNAIPPDFRDRLEGAFLARMAGCILGSPVEFTTIEHMESLAKDNREKFPPVDYWKEVPEGWRKRYEYSLRSDYTRGRMDGVPVDDDIAYTLLGLLILERYGPDFTVADVGRAWKKRLPIACTAERVALDNLKKGIPARRAGAVENPYCEWIGADIRSDPWGYLAPGWPEKAAELAWRDAYLSHRREGIYGEMFFAAAISAAFAVDDPVEALEIGLTEIPRDAGLAKAVKWALAVSPRIRNYAQARAAVEKRFKGMHRVHTINNACLTVFGIAIGKKDVTRVIGETVAMGMDNDCTAATAGSLVGAVVGARGVPARWTRPFRNKVHSYLRGPRIFKISDLLARFERQAKRVFSAGTGEK
ncbi:MAG: ADP-ribosylglycohydrolase family protein [Planctomycetota bacterium]